MGGTSSSAQLELRLLLKDPGVRKELSSWRWKLIFALCTAYCCVFFVFSMKEYGSWFLDSLRVPDETRVSITRTINTKKLQTKEVIKSYAINDARDCARKNARYALAQLMQLRSETKTAEPPLIIGGIGDSGTRAVAYIVTQLGVWMGKFGVTVKKDSRDSKLFINGFNTYTCDANDEPLEGVIKSYVFYSRSIQTCNTLNYQQSCVNPLYWNQGVQWASTMFRTMLNHTKLYTARRANRDMYPFKLWGFKHPRSAFVLPYLSYVLQNKMRYIHITRDGRDIAAGDNQYFFNSVCERYYEKDDPRCEDVYRNRVSLWSKLNLDVLDWAKANLEPDQFLIVRIEDLVGGERSCFERLAKFTRTSNERAEQVIRKSIALFTVKNDRYYGKKYTTSEKRAYTKAVKSDPMSVRAFKAFGYDIDNWGTVGSCDDLRFPIENV